jgi:sporulation protein YlmC with PRC-barrel domain
MGGHVARMGEKRNAYRILLGKPEGKRPLGRPRRRWVDNIKMDLREIGWDEVSRIKSFIIIKQILHTAVCK